MSAGSYNEILKRVRDELSYEEQLRLAEELAKNGHSVESANTGSRSLFDALTDRGLVGFMHDAPVDLSSNPQHMEGFGQHAE